MKTRLIIIAEIVLFVIFVSATIITKLKIARLGYMGVISFVLLGALYFPLGFYTLKTAKINTKPAGFFGILLSLGLVAIFFRILHASFSAVLLLFFIAIFLLLGIAEVVATKLVKQPEGKIIPRDTAFIIRYIVLFVSMAVALVVFL